MGESNLISFFQTAFPWFGITGSLMVSLSVLAAAPFYRGKHAQKYSLFNHYISELGEVGVSKAAWVFNLGLILGGLCFLPFVLGLGFTLDSVWGYLGMAAGIWAGVSCSLVGVFPMNRMEPHIKVAMSFFRSGLVTILLFGLAILFQPAGRQVVPLWVTVFSLLGVLVYSFFLIKLRKPDEDEENEVLDPEAKKQRPRFWLTPMLEWGVFFVTIFWFMGVALGL